jgi:hypothetical protein
MALTRFSPASSTTAAGKTSIEIPLIFVGVPSDSHQSLCERDSGTAVRKDQNISLGRHLAGNGILQRLHVLWNRTLRWR